MRLLLTMFALALGDLILSYDSVHAAFKQLDIPVLIDAYVESGFPSTITYGQRNLYLGLTPIFGKQKTRIYIKPNLSILNSSGITPDRIHRVKLFLYLYQTGATIDQRISIYKVGSNWESTDLTWGNQPPVAYYYYSWVSPAIGFKEFTLTNAFKQQYQHYLDTNENRGFMLRMVDENQGYYVFWSNECTLSLTPPFCADYMRPYFRVEYRDNSVPGAPAQQAPQASALLNQSRLQFEWAPTTDPDGDPLEYRVIIARDPDFNDLYKQTTWSSSTAVQVTIGKDGQYYWKVNVRDPYGNQNSSSTSSFTVDTHAPAVPVLVDVPPYIKDREITLSWFIAPYEEEVEYELQWAEEPAFESPNTTGWIREATYRLTNLKEGRYYLRVRSRDKAGNVSGWSRGVSFIVDLNKPELLEFSVDPKQHNKRGNKKIRVKIQAQDTTLERVGIMIYSSGGGAVLEQFKQDDKMTYYWDVNNYPDGHYFVYAIVEDKLGNRIISEPIEVQVDSQAPDIYVEGVNPEENILTNKVFNIDVSCSESARLSVDIGSKKHEYSMSKYIPQRLTFDWHNAKKRIRLYCVDALGNKSSNFSFTLHIDKIPPKAPVLNIFGASKRITVTASCYKGEQVVFGVGDKTLGTKRCVNRGVSFNVPFKPQSNTVYVFWAKRIDEAGNHSTKAFKEFKYRGKVQIKRQSLPNARCDVDIVIAKDGLKVKNTSCSRFNHNILKVVEGMQNNMQYLEIYQAVPNRVQVSFRFHSCTLFGIIGRFLGRKCSPSYIGQVKGVFQPYYRAQILGGSSTVIPVGVKKGVRKFRVPAVSADVRLKTDAYLLGPLAVPELNRKIAMNIRLASWQNRFRVSTQQFLDISKPFRWIFNDYNKLRVSQWFGKTRFSRFHHGIDIATMPRIIFAPAGGKIISAGYHRKNKCFAGGYYIGISHNNGLYTYYFHLSNLKMNGKKRFRGQSIIVGEPLAVTGRSGRYRCKPLGYHLHFEVRTCGTSRCSVNPVSYVQADWKRLGYTK